MAIQQTEQIQIKRRLFTLTEYERMIEAGILQEDERLELISGEIVKMPPIGFDHGMGVAKLTGLFNRSVGDKALIWPQGPIQLDNKSRPEPDIALLKLQEYGAKKPVTASDVLLIIEVADTTLKSDRTVKSQLYAQAGIPEYWIVNLPDGVIEVFTEPSEGVYKQTKKTKRGDTLVLPSELGTVQVDDILGKV